VDYDLDKHAMAATHRKIQSFAFRKTMHMEGSRMKTIRNIHIVTIDGNYAQWGNDKHGLCLIPLIFMMGVGEIPLPLGMGRNNPLDTKCQP
jgi:hypothetical protein